MIIKKRTVVVFSVGAETVKGTVISLIPESYPDTALVRVNGESFRWEGGPDGEYLDSKDNLVPGKIAYADAIWHIPIRSISYAENSERTMIVKQKPTGSVGTA